MVRTRDLLKEWRVVYDPAAGPSLGTMLFHQIGDCIMAHKLQGYSLDSFVENERM